MLGASTQQAPGKSKAASEYQRRLSAIEAITSSSMMARRWTRRNRDRIYAGPSETPPVQSRQEESMLIRELLLLDAVKLAALKADWLTIGEQLTRTAW